MLESWEGVRAWVMPERKRVEFWVWQRDECYKLEIAFENIMESFGCGLGGEEVNALLLKLKFGPRIFRKISGPNVAARFSTDRYHVCKDDFDFLWVRTTDFSDMKSIGYSTSFCWEIEEEFSVSDVFECFPYYKDNDVLDLILDNGEKYCSPSETVPLVKCGSDSKLPYEILFQLNALVHSQKISLAATDSDLIEFLSGLSVDTTNVLLEKLHKRKTTCYDPLSFLKMQLHVLERSHKSRPSPYKRLMEHNVMSCHRVLITPSKICCLGPELEKSNYVVKNFAAYASDFMRVTFVDEDWSKLPANAISTSIQQGIFAKPHRTGIYHRMLSILRDGIVIGEKRFEFLAFSASQLRSSSVWMFSSNDNDGSTVQFFYANSCCSCTRCRDIPDVETSSDGVTYCFSDGIGKISLSFARKVAQKCGLDQTPSAFQIRYGGYKGVIAVDCNSFRKLSLRSSMLKFESKNRMLNVTKWSDAMPCYLNREIISLLSTLGVKDETFEALQEEQLRLLGKMRTERGTALNVLERLNGADSKNTLVKMLLHGYEPNVEPYLSMMLQAYYENHLSDLKSRCRIFVPKGRVLVGCLDETGNLNYGQVYVRITMTKAEQEMGDQSFFQKVDETTCIVTGKVVVTKNPCLHPGDVRVLDAVYDVVLEEKNMVDCLIFPQKGERPHPNECSGGDLDGDLFFISWDKDLVPSYTVPPMDYSARRPRIMDHTVTLEEIQKFFVDYMINDNLGAISTAHLVHADHEPDKALNPKCLQLADLHSMAVDFAKTGAPAEMSRTLKPKEFPDFMERVDKPMYISNGALGKLYRAVIGSVLQEKTNLVWSEQIAGAAYDQDLEVDGLESVLEVAKGHRDIYLQRDNRRYGDMKDRISLSLKNLQKEAKGLFESSCPVSEHQRMASAWYHVTYHPSYFQQDMNCLSFPWIVGDILLNIKAVNNPEKDIRRIEQSTMYLNRFFCGYRCAI
ncbi:RNA-dependent RNA polymerase 2 [Prunus yedoensis var. nudiflora]|uniref:RNA-dependent RNA polymerase n=1 Tax=Prunus yedoensis var. nudiflora TaxID=2094558 RepID=A0A314Y4G0_PRUYE|nr:RNA-dependent RNA polymerase 2 [Prunus yedoensis var. nudiflora]